MLASASIFNSLAGIAVDVISLFMALLSSRGISTPSLQARGEQRRFFYFNNDRDIPTKSAQCGFVGRMCRTSLGVLKGIDDRRFQPGALSCLSNIIPRDAVIFPGKGIG